MQTAPVVRRLAEPLMKFYRRALAAFPVAKKSGCFLNEPLPDSLINFSTNGEPTLSNIGWQLVTSHQYYEEAYIRWCYALKTEPKLKRKQWEWVYILEVLNKYGLLRDGARGLGFGCGKEPLPSLMAKLGCNIVVTDLEKNEAAKSGWIDGNQHASHLKDLNYPKILDPSVFARKATFRACDMNDIPDDLSNFDFVWSSCSLEHLGSLENGLHFIENSAKCLRPGGVAVHTTEFNLGSNEKTLESGGACIYRKRDIEGLALRLIKKGYQIGKINFLPGSEPPDLFIDLPPYKSAIHLRLIVKRHLTTSIGLFLKREN